ncbi:RCC1 domain-containing protein [Algicola sagamiensis]|uniref:hypothetical protein n=1 Tax=Algicola sagamiensis TaxID=163869 RepID=UPI000368645C|nr:hypothetical protein [Algicola sagamiensis]
MLFNKRAWSFISLLSMPFSSFASVDIQLTASDEKPVLQRTGGLLDYNQSIQNTGADTIELETYSYFTFPDGKVYMPLPPTVISLDAGQSYEKSGQQLNIPESFPAGDFTYHLNTYNQTTSEIKTAAFSFQKKSEILDIIMFEGYACATDLVGTLCWAIESRNDFFEPTPEPLKNMTHIDVTRNAACAVYDGKVDCWDHIYHGLRRTIGSKWYRTSEVNFVNPKEVYVGISGSDACAVDDEGIKCWNHNGQWSKYGVVPIPDYNALVNPGPIHVGRYTACIKHDGGISCWGSKKYDSKPSIAVDVPTVTNPTHLAVTNKYACASGDEGLQCWGNVPSKLSSPVLKPNTILSSKTRSIYSLDDRGYLAWWVGGENFRPLPYTFDNPSKVVMNNDTVCGLDNTGIQCFSRRLPQYTTPVPDRFRY